MGFQIPSLANAAGDQDKVRASNKKRRKQNRSWLSPNRQGNVLQRAIHDQKVKSDDKKWVKKTKTKLADRKRKNRRSASSFTAEELLEVRKKARVSREKKEDRAKLKKENPKKYREMRRKELRIERQNRMRRGR